ncbi:MAG TPA: GNAT family acetyltransferase [Burkholderiaceae bacterium]|nr:GNAT family acetyltransferase [Burkholderiaceae bacterium]
MSGIRRVGSGDTEAIVVLWRDVFPEYNDPARPQRDPRANIARKLAFGDGLFWLVEMGDRVVATAMAGYDGHRGWIYSIGVAPAERGRGHARALLAHAEAQLRALGCPKINIQVLADKEEALRFWRAAGYQPDPVVSLGRRL